MAAVAGVAYFKRNGVQYSLKGAMTIRPLNRTREPVVGQDGFHGYKETEVSPSISAEITDNPKLSIVAFQEATNETITVELVNGKSYILSNAFYSGDGELDGSEGSTVVTFNGSRCVERLG